VLAAAIALVQLGEYEEHRREMNKLAFLRRYSICLLCQYKSTDTDAEGSLGSFNLLALQVQKYLY
jgi:hypothetical protein